MIVSPPVGWPVQFLVHGDDRNLIAATVTKSGSGGVVSVSLLQEGGGMVVSKGGVRNSDDPWCQQFEEQVRRGNNGTWRFIPGLEWEEPKQEIDARRESGLRRVEELALAGGEVDDIAKKVRTFGLTREDVEDKLETLTTPA